VVIHDPNKDEPTTAFALARLVAQPDRPTPIGIFRDVERPVYDELLREQVEQAKRRAGRGRSRGAAGVRQRLGRRELSVDRPSDALSLDTPARRRLATDLLGWGAGATGHRRRWCRTCGTSSRRASPSSEKSWRLRGPRASWLAADHQDPARPAGVRRPAARREAVRTHPSERARHPRSCGDRARLGPRPRSRSCRGGRRRSGTTRPAVDRGIPARCRHG
jgi:hypothetical protein